MTFEELRSDWGYMDTFSLEDAVRKWERVVSNVESGYNGTFYEYEAELAFREDLDQVVAEMPQEVRLRERLTYADQRFLAASVRTDSHLLEAPDDARLAIWSRVPATLHPADSDVAQTWRI